MRAEICFRRRHCARELGWLRWRDCADAAGRLWDQLVDPPTPVAAAAAQQIDRESSGRRQRLAHVRAPSGHSGQDVVVVVVGGVPSRPDGVGSGESGGPYRHTACMYVCRVTAPVVMVMMPRRRHAARATVGCGSCSSSAC